MQLYPHQVTDRSKIREAFRDHRRVLYVAPTGSGKTELFVDIAVSHLRKNPDALVYILVHRTELMDQVVATVASHGEKCGRLAASDHPDGNERIVVVSVHTGIRRLGRIQRPTFIIIDEAHHATASTSWGKISAAFGSAPVLGVTATPCRLSGEGLSECFSVLVSGPTVRWLIDHKYLAEPRVYCPAVPDVRDVHSRGGEFISSELEKILTQSTITGDAIDAYQKYAAGTQFVCFGVSRSHIETVAARFRDSGIKAVAIDGTLAKEERSNRVRAFRERELTGLISCNLIDEGFNVPGIECGIDLAPTKSLSRYLQRVGRCLRVSPGKRIATILDLAGNALRHGLPDAGQNWSLSGTRGERTGAPKDPVPSVRICPDCLAANASTSDFCSLCGVIFAVNGRTFSTQKGELQILRESKAAEIAAARVAAEKARDEQKGTYGYAALVGFARSKGYKNPERWAWIIHNARQKKKQKMRVRL